MHPWSLLMAWWGKVTWVKRRRKFRADIHPNQKGENGGIEGCWDLRNCSMPRMGPCAHNINTPQNHKSRKATRDPLTQLTTGPGIMPLICQECRTPVWQGWERLRRHCTITVKSCTGTAPAMPSSVLHEENERRPCLLEERTKLTFRDLERWLSRHSLLFQQPGHLSTAMCNLLSPLKPKPSKARVGMPLNGALTATRSLTSKYA